MSENQTPATTNKPAASIGQVSLQSFADRAKQKMEGVLKKHMNPDRMIRLAFREIAKNPKLKDCSPESFVASLVECAELGLEPGSHLGHVYLIPYFNKHSGKTECQAQTSYLGEMELVKRSGKVSQLTAHCYHENDHFDYELGTSPRIEHKPAVSNRGAILGAYAVARLEGGQLDLEIIGLEEIYTARKSSKGRTVWEDHFGEMARKTVLRRLIKRLPKSTEVGENQNLVDGEE